MKAHLQQLVPYLLQLLLDPNPLVRSITCWTLSRYIYWILEQPAIFPKVVEGLFHSMMDRNKKVQEAAVSAVATLCEQAVEMMVPYLKSAIQCICIAFSRYQQKNTFLLLDAVGALAEAVRRELNQPEYIEALMPPIINRWNALTDSDPSLLSVLQCLSYVAPSLGVGFQPYALPVYQRCIKIIELVTGTAHYEGFLTSCIDLIAGLVEALGPGAEPLIAQSNIIPLSSKCLGDPRPGVQQSTLALLGDLSMQCPHLLQPHLNILMPAVINHIEPQFVSVCNNASWTVGELCVRITPQELDPYIAPIMHKLITLMNKKTLNQQLRDNIAITLGRISTAAPQKVAVLLKEFFAPWGNVIRGMRRDLTRESAIKGFCQIIQANPTDAANFLPTIVAVAASWEIHPQVSQEITHTLHSILHGYKTNVSPALWADLQASTDPKQWACLQQNFKI